MNVRECENAHCDCLMSLWGTVLPEFRESSDEIQWSWNNFERIRHAWLSVVIGISGADGKIRKEAKIVTDSFFLDVIPKYGKQYARGKRKTPP